MPLCTGITRVFIETVNNELKNIVQKEHTRRRIEELATNLMAAYSFLPKKPTLNIEITKEKNELLRPN